MKIILPLALFALFVSSVSMSNARSGFSIKIESPKNSYSPQRKKPDKISGKFQIPPDVKLRHIFVKVNGKMAIIHKNSSFTLNKPKIKKGKSN